jgi:hypothetical protein
MLPIVRKISTSWVTANWGAALLDIFDPSMKKRYPVVLGDCSGSAYDFTVKASMVRAKAFRRTAKKDQTGY